MGNGEIKLDPERIAPLKDLEVPKSKKELQRILGLFSYYSKWAPNFSEIIRPLVQNEAFPLSNDAISAFYLMKNKIAEATLQPIDKAVPFIVETDASNFTIAATLNQNGKPVPFHVRALSTSEQRHLAVEKEAYAVVEALQKWKHLLLGKHFRKIQQLRSQISVACRLCLI